MTTRAPQQLPKRHAKGEWLETDTGNKIHRRALLEGLSHIVLLGRVVIHEHACLRGDLIRPASTPTIARTNTTAASASSSLSKSSLPSVRASITIGRYTVISSHAVLHPPYRIVSASSTSSSSTTPNNPGISYIPMTLGQNIYIGASSYISAASIGSNCYIGAGVVLGNACVLGERVKVLDGAVVPDAMQVPSGVVVGGRPARVLDEVGEGWGMAMAFGGVEVGEWCEGGELRELVKSVNVK